MCVGVEKLVRTTGKGMARAHGMPEYNFAVIVHEMGVLEDLRSQEQIDAIAENLVPQIVHGLTGIQPIPAPRTGGVPSP